jgi:hypothetical protein
MKKKLFHGILMFLLTCLINNTHITAQSCTNVDELFRKRHTIQGMTYGHPYTTFDRHNDNYKNLQNCINNIRLKIISDKQISNVENLRGPVYKAYKIIYDSATKTRPTDNGMPHTKEVSPLAVWAKNNAFVFLIGLDSVGNYMDNTLYNGASQPSGNKRDAFRDRAMHQAFGQLTGEIDIRYEDYPFVAAFNFTSALLGSKFEASYTTIRSLRQAIAEGTTDFK